MFRNDNILFDEYNEYNLYYNLLKRGKNLTNIPNFLVKYRVHPDAMSSYDKKRQEKLRDEVIKKFNELDDKTNVLDKLSFYIELFFHYIKTMHEKNII